MVSMKHIAELLNVSSATVSLVLNGKSKGRVNPELEARILETARNCDYRLNEVARNLRTGQTKTIGVIVTDISNEFFGRITFHIQEIAKREGYLVIVVNSNEDPSDFSTLADMLLNKRVDGLIAVPTENSLPTLERIKKSGVPMVLLDRHPEGITADYVGVDNFNSSRKAVSRMLLGGCRRIAVLCYDLDLNALKDRVAGYEAVLSSNGIFDPSLVFMIDYDRQKEEIEKALDRCIAPECGVDGIFFCSRRVFTEGIRIMNGKGLELGHGISLMCFDEVDVIMPREMNIEYMSQPIRQMGEAAITMLLEQITGRQESVEKLFDVSEPVRPVLERKS